MARWCVVDTATMGIVGGPYEWNGLMWGPDGDVQFPGLPELGPFPESSDPQYHPYPTHLTMLESEALAGSYTYPPVIWPDPEPEPEPGYPE